MLSRLLSSLYRAFGKDPAATVALRVRHPDGFAWRVASRQLTARTLLGAPLGTFDLATVSFSQLATALAGLGCQIVFIDPASAWRRADTLLDGASDETHTNGDALACYTSPLWAILDTFSAALEVASDTADAALQQAVMDTARGEWLDYWGGHFGVLRNVAVAGGVLLDEAEDDAHYLARIVREVLRPRVTKIAVEQAVADLDGEDIVLFEPWTQVFKLSESPLSDVYHLHDGVFWTWNIIQPVIYGPHTSANWERVLAIIDRNRPAGVLVAPWRWEPDVIWAEPGAIDAAVVVRGRSSFRVNWPNDRPLGEMILDDNEFMLNLPVVVRGRTTVMPTAPEGASAPAWDDSHWDSRLWSGEGQHAVAEEAPAVSVVTS